MESTRTWDDRALLLLGVLMNQSRHGYQINEFIENSLCDVVTMKKPTAYALLDRLAADGFITVQLEQAGNRPQRKVYTITDAGRHLFDTLLRENLSTYEELALPDNIGLMYLKHLPPGEVITLLKARLQALDELIANKREVPPHGGILTVEIALDHVAARRRADREWLVRTIARLEQQLATPEPSR